MPFRKRVTSAFAVLFVLFLTSCSTGPADVAVTFTKHMAAGRIDDLMPHLSSDFQSFGEEKLHEVFSETAEERFGEGKNRRKVKIEVVSEEIDGDFATVVLKITRRDGETWEETYELVREDGKWKITPGRGSSK